MALLTPYQPRSFTLEDAAHLARRTAFGATADELRALQSLGPDGAARHLLEFGPEELADNPFDPARAEKNAAGLKLAQWRWFHELVFSPHPLREKLALFWSNHFVIGLDKVRHPGMIAQYLGVLRSHGLASFERLALEVARSPAMLRYLDNDQNRKGQPNENFARELLELFTTGIGHYTEVDVREAARAFTGWSYHGGAADPAGTPQFRFNRRQHDDGRKTFLGHSGTLTGEDIVALAARHPATSAFVSAKLWRAFVNDTPDPAGVAELAGLWRDTGGDLRRVVAALIGSEAFYAPRNRRAIHNSPLEFVVGAMRALGRPAIGEAKQYQAWIARTATMGQELLHPPTVEGWKGGRTWVHDTALLLRAQSAAALTLSERTAFTTPAEDLSLALLGLTRAPFAAALEALDPRRRAYLLLVSPEYALA